MAKETINVADNPKKWDDYDLDRDGTISNSEYRKYKNKNKKVVKSIEKQGEDKYVPSIDENADFYNETAEEKGLTGNRAKQYNKQKALAERNGSITVINKEGDSKPEKESSGGSPIGTSIKDIGRVPAKKEEPITEPEKSTGYSGADSVIEKALKPEPKVYANEKERIDDQIATAKATRASEGTYDEQNKKRINDPRAKQNESYKNQYGVNGSKNEIFYDSTPTEGAKAVKSAKKYVDTKNADNEVQLLKEGENFYNDRISEVDNATQDERSLRNGLKGQMTSEQIKNKNAQKGVEKQFTNDYNTDLHAKKRQLAGYNKSLKSYDEFIEKNGIDPKQWDYETRQAYNALAGENPEAAQAFKESIEARSQLQGQIDWMEDLFSNIKSGEASWQDLGFDETELNQLKAKGEEIANDLIGIGSANLDSLSILSGKYGTEKQQNLLGQIQQLYQSFSDNTGMDLSPEAREQMMEGLKSARQGLRDELDNDLAIVDARNEMVSSINKFMFFAIDDAITAYSIYMTLQIGNPTDAIGKLSQMGQRNARFNKAETDFKAGILDNEAENIKRDQTAENTAWYNSVLNDAEIQKYRDLKVIDSEESYRELLDLKKAFDQYQNMEEAFKAFYSARQLGKNTSGWSSMVAGLIQSGALNYGDLEKLVSGIPVGDTSSDVNKKTDILKVSGKANTWMDNAFNSAKPQPEEPTEQIDPTILNMKQGQLQASLQQKMQAQQPMQAQGPAPAKGWGK